MKANSITPPNTPNSLSDDCDARTDYGCRPGLFSHTDDQPVPEIGHEPRDPLTLRYWRVSVHIRRELLAQGRSLIAKGFCRHCQQNWSRVLMALLIKQNKPLALMQQASEAITIEAFNA